MSGHRLFAGIVAAALLLSVACGGDDGGDVAVDASDQVFPSLQAFLDSDESSTAPRPVVFVGIDAAAWEFIDPLIARGALPHLARVKAEGASAVLRSLPCFVSPPAWATMMTGYLPAKTGVYSYGQWLPDRREFGTVDKSNVLVPSLWDVASYCGRTVGVFNVPMSYPPAPVEGAIVGGMMTPYQMHDPIHGRPLSPRPEWTPQKNFTDHSPVRRTATTDSLNSYLWSLHDTSDDGERNYGTVVLEVRPGGDVYTFAIDTFSPWIRIRALRDGAVADGFMKAGVFVTADGRVDTRLSPVFDAIDASFTFPESLAEVLENQFGFYVPSVFLAPELVTSLAGDAVRHASFFYGMDDWDLYMYVFTQSDNMHHHSGFSPEATAVYQTIDSFVGEVMEKMPDGATLIVASDHGFKEYEWGIDLNRMLQELGLLARHDDGAIDHNRTLVFHNLWHLYFNHELITREELGRRGIAVPDNANPIDYLAGYLTQVAGAIQTADGAHNVSIPLVRLPAESATDPDMRVDGASGKYVVDFVYENRHPAVFYPLEGHERWWHQRDGIVMAWGGNVKPGATGMTFHIQDVAPTILNLLGAPIAADMDGTIMEGLFDRRPPQYTVPDYSGMPDVPVAQKKFTESLEKKLKSLGYLR